MSESPARFDHSDYTVGWICALPETELVAAGAMLDEEHPVLPAADPHDTNSYLLGRIGDHNVVIACLPAETTGKVSAATVAKDMLRSFPAVRFGLMVGIGGGAPYYGSPGNNNGENEQSEEEDSEDDSKDMQDIRLGDVVISLHSKSTEAVVQYDFGKSVQAKEFIHVGGKLNKPPHIVMNAVSMLRGQHARKGLKIPKLLAEMLADNPLMATKFSHPGSGKDRLFKSDIIHNDGKKSCKTCCGPDNVNLVKRKDRHNNDPQLHYGTIGSADRVLKDATLRDKWAEKEKIKCFEMEAAGLMDSFPCLVIRGICDYADSHKSKVWQPYAAATAASYAKELLLGLPGQGVRDIPSIKQSLGRIAADVDILKSNFDKMESSGILDWLTPVNYGPQQTDNLRRQQPGTGQWVINSTEFQNWVNAGKQTLFCPGIPGAGKTILTAIVIDELYKKFQSDASVGIAYIYCNFRQHHEQKAEDLLASLLKQLCQQKSSLLEGVQLLCNRHKNKQTHPTLGELSAVLQSVAAMYSRIFIVVDALDESQLYNGCRSKFLSEISTLQNKCGANIFATSRFVPDIEKMFEGSERIEIRASADDVRRYLDGNISQLPAFVTSSPEFLEEVKTVIVNAVDGMFLLARLHLNSLVGKVSRKSIRTTLQALPTGSDAYDYAYNEVVERIEGAHKEQKALAKQIISWITCAKRPFTTFELQHALAVELGSCELDQDNIPPIELMVSVCAGLVTIDEASRVIRLVHYTTQEYFERTQKHWFPDAETDITRICVTYLSFNTFKSGHCRDYDEFHDRLQSNKLFDYAAQNWGHHARMSSIEGDRLILDFLQNEANILACYQAILAATTLWGYGNRWLTGLHVAAHFGLVQSTAALLNGQHNSSPTDTDGEVPLHYAAQNGHQEVVKLLLDKGADPNTSISVERKTPLHYAAENGHQEIVKLLLDKDADPNIYDYGRTPLHGAAENGYQDVVKLLLDKDADPNINKYAWKPLHDAAKNGHHEVVKLLLDKDADPNINYFGRTPLHEAAENGHQDIVKLLLDKDADPNINNYAWTPLHNAAMNGHYKIVKLLLDKDADPNINRSGVTPLERAVRRGHQDVVKLLLDQGANPNISHSYSKTPLHYAARNMHHSIVKLLHDRGAHPANTIINDSNYSKN